VFEMLNKYQGRVEFTGGFEAARLRPWHVEALRKLKPRQIFFAYDSPNNLESLQIAGKMLFDAGWNGKSHRLRCYVLIGYPRDTFDAAEARLREASDAGFLPMAMLWRNHMGIVDLNWRKFQRRWARPAILAKILAK
jgi:hypothetical protein